MAITEAVRADPDSMTRAYDWEVTRLIDGREYPGALGRTDNRDRAEAHIVRCLGELGPGSAGVGKLQAVHILSDVPPHTFAIAHRDTDGGITWGFQ